MIRSVNPATGEQLAAFEPDSDQSVDERLTAAVEAQQKYRGTTPSERAALLRRIATTLRDKADDLALLISQEMGKPLTEARAEIEKCAITCEYYATNAIGFLADEPVRSNASQSRIVYDPLGVVLAVMPWNYPFWQFFRFAAPALAAGNGIVLKHANSVPQSALAIAAVIHAAGTPEGLVQVLLVETPKVAELIADDRIAAVTFTGSTEVGTIIASQAGAALKKQVLELGGSDPFVSRTPMCRLLLRPRSRRGSPTSGRAASTRSGSSSRSRSRTSSSKRSARRPIAWSSAIHSTRPLPSAHWHVRTCASPCTSRPAGRSRPEPSCCAAANRSTARATTASRQCSTTSYQGWPRSTRRRSAHSRRSHARRRPTRRSGSRTGPSSASAPHCGPAIRPRPSGTAGSSTRGRCSSTGWLPRTPGCRSAGSSAPGTAGSSARTGCASS